MLTALAAIALLAVTGCSPTATTTVGTSLSGSITVLDAASLTSSFAQLGKDFEAVHPGVHITFSPGASSALAQQILAGSPADVFASASVTNMTEVTDKGAASDPRTFATNVAEVAVAPGSASTIARLADLAKPGVKVALCQPEVPCGALAVSVLAKANVSVTPATLGLDVKGTLAYVLNGQADAAIVYATDVLAAGDKVKAVAIPVAQNASTSYPIAVLKASKNPALAQAFANYVLSPAGQAVLAAAGFAKP
jgi:molybdate transport system substrate-binding protein